MSTHMPEPQGTVLGKTTEYRQTYDASLLQPIARTLGRDAIGAHSFLGGDLWHLYELTWLNEAGLPQVAVGEVYFPASTPYIIESKSFKLYLVSFSQVKLTSIAHLEDILRTDLSAAAGGDVRVHLHRPSDWMSDITPLTQAPLEAGYDAERWGAITVYEPDASLLKPSAEAVDGADGRLVCVNTQLFRSLCPVTGQPDHATVFIDYQGAGIDRVSILKYLVSYRAHRGFHEQCVEHIFTDLMRAFSLKYLRVTANFTRRGGLDINPTRTTDAHVRLERYRDPRQ